ncbi:MAG: AAA family ATPase [Bdellovibrionia bacterium]
MDRRQNLALEPVNDSHQPNKVRPFVKKPRSSRSHDSGQLNLRQLWKLVKINKYVVGSAVILAVTLTSLHAFFATPIYKASVTLTVTTGEQQTLQGVLGDLTGDNELVQKMHALSEYFRSGEMNERLVDAIKRNGSTPYVVLSQKGLERFLVNLGLRNPMPASRMDGPDQKNQLANELMGMLSINPNFSNSTMTIEASTPNPELAAMLANEAAHALVAINHKVGLRKVQEVKQFLTTQTTELGSRLEKLETELADFQARNQIISENEASRSVYSTLDRHESQYIDAQIKLSTNSEMIARIEKDLKGLKENITRSDFSGSNLYLSQLQHRLSMLQYQQAMQKSGDEATSPAESKMLQDEITGLVGSYQKALENRDNVETAASLNPLEYYQKLEASLAALRKDNEKFRADSGVLNKAITRQKGAFPKLASNLQHLTELKRNIQLTSDLYLAIRKKLQEAQIQEAGTIKTVDVLTEATVPGSPFAVSLTFKVSFAIAVGLFFGILFVLTHEALVPAVRHRHDIEQNGIYVLGEVPLADFIGPSKRGIIPINDNPNSYEADSFRFIKMRLASHVKHRPGQPAPVLLVTSPRSGNGKTFTSVNLAMTLAKAKMKTLLVDMDLRKPSCQKYFDQVETTIEGLAKDPKLKDFGKITTTINPYLDVVFGTHHIIHPPEFLEGESVPTFLSEMRQKYDFIIIDSAPILGIIDSSIMAKMVDHVLFVVEHRKTLREDLAMALHTLREVHHKPLLSILNCVHKEFGYYDNKYYVVRSSQLQTQDLG